MLDRHLNSPWTSSAGRLFDAMAALAGLRSMSHFEGQAAMDLEFAAEAQSLDVPDANEPAYRMALRPNIARTNSDPRWAPCWILDWEPVVRAALDDRARNVPAGTIAWRFHLALVDGIVQVAQAAGEPRVALSGGCFQNALLTERTVRALEAAGFRPYWHQRVPPNDGGIALGQIAVAAAQARHRRGRDHSKARAIATAHPASAASAACTNPPLAR
jgi:hydrogenase maturation protein HypF